jgi:hypothetical protein
MFYKIGPWTLKHFAAVKCFAKVYAIAGFTLSHFYPSRIFWGIDASWRFTLERSLIMRSTRVGSCLLTHIRLGWKCLVVTNVLTYSNTVSITTEKRSIE